jgi:hypothetical protein
MDITYQITVTNKNQTSDRNVVVTFTAPAETTPLPDPNGALQNRTLMTVRGQTITFDPIKEIRPGESIPFKVVVRANQAGTSRARVDVRSDGTQQGVAAETEVPIFGQ